MVASILQLFFLLLQSYSWRNRKSRVGIQTQILFFCDHPHVSYTDQTFGGRGRWGGVCDLGIQTLHANVSQIEAESKGYSFLGSES